MSTAKANHKTDQIVCKSEDCLHYLLPTEQDQSAIGRLQSANKLLFLSNQFAAWMTVLV